MSAIPSATLAATPANASTAIPGWRYASVLLGAAIGLCFSFPILFNASLPFFLLPLSQEFGWGRGSTSAVAVMAMLGVTLASPFAGRLFDRFGPERVIGVSMLLFSAGVFCMSLLPPSLVAVGALCFVIGVVGCGTTMIGYAGVLPRWFDRRLGLALGVAGLGAGLGVGLVPFVATHLIGDLGWRSAYAALAALALGGGVIAFLLLRPRSHERQPVISCAATLADRDVAIGMTITEARREGRFWLLFAVTFLVPFAILGIALHGAALFMDRGLSAQQAATGAALAGLGALGARLCVGALIDRWHAPRVTALVFLLAGTGLALNSWAVTFPLLCIGTFLGGIAMGAEGDLLPFMIRRYFGLRAFGAIFGTMHSAYALGGVLGPIAYGLSYDRLHTYSPVMLGCAALCLASAIAIGWMGPYRYQVVAHAR
jgi:MFS transporter, OFA family, oxalate/formate antiporter